MLSPVSTDEKGQWLLEPMARLGRPPRRKNKRSEPIGPVLTLGEVAYYLRVHPSTIYRLVKRKALPAFKVGTDWRFDVEALNEWRFGQDNHTPKKK